ncbi:single-stranded-DNA-specific exonuclease RecJ [bacterium]|jgi:single-stranded-DNA-specific exonuclease|nr:single-stranded-DNA-specific exonuclease RecJ [bacterium]MBT6831592.1 single-stranded-DNA-specific exonuclease RecJ [bacterium]MBT6995887.1 single-stranded-DNA-specific exonuclease RecJ [bacterium]MBT7772661.1 single-stranded-DNA-specific exonuclease RecJ [bacterium]
MSVQRSLSKKNWVPPSFFSKNTEIPTVENLEKLQEILLAARGLDSHEKIENFLSPSFSDLADPFEMSGMSAAVDRIFVAIEKKERIVVFGDFDADGITSTVILVTALQKFGAEVSYRIPDRNAESHGLKTFFIDELHEKKVSLVITVDCATNDAREISYAKKLGIDVIVTDHHAAEKERFPHDAVAIVNPRLDPPDVAWSEISGAAVAWKVAAALAQTKFSAKNPPDAAEKISKFLWPLLEIAAIGVVADCVDLVKENRIFAKFGLQKMRESSWDAVRRLVADTNPTEETIAFSIAPRLNAASRIGDVLVALQLFLGDKKENVVRLKKLEMWNDERKKLTEISVDQSRTQVVPDAPIQIFRGNWKPGVLGLLASRHVEQLGVPVVACTDRADGKIAASCRAPEGSSIVAALQACGELFEVFGGHAGAAGFLAPGENFSKICDALISHFSTKKPPELSVRLDAWVDLELLDFSLLDFLHFLAPFGAGNPQPIFGLKKLKITRISPMGAQKNHLRISVDSGSQRAELVAFFAGHLISNLSIGDEIDAAVTISENLWNGKRRLQFLVVDARKSVAS